MAFNDSDSLFEEPFKIDHNVNIKILVKKYLILYIKFLSSTTIKLSKILIPVKAQ